MIDAGTLRIREVRMAEANDFNRRIIEEFRANQGHVGGPFQGAPMLLLHTTGARSGVEWVTPLVYLPVDGGMAIFASKAGAPAHPAWYHNLVATPRATVEVGTDTYPVTARVTEGEERDRIWARQKQVMPGFAEYEVRASPRVIPVVALERTS